jgi:hypothetical protein
MKTESEQQNSNSNYRYYPVKKNTKIYRYLSIHSLPIPVPTGTLKKIKLTDKTE